MLLILLLIKAVSVTRRAKWGSTKINKYICVCRIGNRRRGEEREEKRIIIINHHQITFNSASIVASSKYSSVPL